MPDVAVIDYGMGNLRSVAKALVHVAPDASIVVTDDPATIRNASRVVLPGQSAMPDSMDRLNATGLRDVVEACLEDRPFLGVCLGLQMLFDDSEEGPTRGLGAVAGHVRRFRDEDMVPASGDRLKVPHMGWSPVRQTRAHRLWSGIEDGERFYFAHSFVPEPDARDITVGTAAYPAPFTCAIARANIFAVQFHPEKSQRAGLRLLANFVAWDGSP
ncbi:MAG: imidazole glycerol phosphate synthase subunit HisH [Betaproteobacteria bacterium]